MFSICKTVYRIKNNETKSFFALMTYLLIGVNLMFQGRGISFSYPEFTIGLFMVASGIFISTKMD